MRKNLLANCLQVIFGLSTANFVYAQVEALNPQQAAYEKRALLSKDKPDAYKDNFMDLSQLESLPVEDDPKQKGSGFRNYLIETRYGFSSVDTTGINARRSSEFGLRAEYYFDTLNYGEFAIQSQTRYRSESLDTNTVNYGAATEKQNGRFTIRNRALPITTDLLANTSIGDVTSEVTEGLTRNHYFSLGANTVRGISTRIYGKNLDIRIGTGLRGSLRGGPYPGFEASTGQHSWLGATHRISKHVYVGGQFNQTTSAPESYRSLVTSLGYGRDLVDDGDKIAKLSVLASQRAAGDFSHASRNATGVFFESGMKSGRYQYEIGGYQTTPNLYFGDSDVGDKQRAGAFGRIAFQGKRFSWNAGFGADKSTNVPNAVVKYDGSQQSINFHGNFQQTLGRDSAWGGGLHVSQSKSNGRAYDTTDTGLNALSANAFYSARVYDLGRSRLSANIRRNQSLVTNGVKASGEELQWEHDWVTGRYETMRPEFVTKLGVARDHSQGQTQIYPTAGIVFNQWVGDDWQMGGNVTYSARNGNLSTNRGLATSLNINKSFNNGWHLGLVASVNQSTYNTDTAFLSRAETIVLATRTQEKSIYLYLRYEGGGGQAREVLGRRTSFASGSGNVTGVVFLDTNRDKIQQFAEIGVQGVDIFLDGAYHTTTDGQGRFEYPSVTTGNHRLSIKIESVPLPWGFGLDRGVFDVEVPLRGTANIQMPLIKPAN